MARTPIVKISDDPKVQELLKAFDTNDDQHLETKEVDADGDGKIDCNQVTQKWMYTKLGPVENALFRAGLISRLRNSICLNKQPISPDKIGPDTLYDFCEGIEDTTFFHKGYKTAGEISHVQQGKIHVNEDQLTTTGLGSCSAVAFSYDGKNFLGHIDAETSPATIVQSIRQNFDVGKLKGDKNFKIVIWVGNMPGNHFAVKVIARALNELGLLDHLVFAGNVLLNVEVGVNSTGTFEK